MSYNCNNIKNSGKNNENGKDYFDLCKIAVAGEWSLDSNRLTPDEKADVILIFEGVQSGKCSSKSNWKDTRNYQTCLDLVKQGKTAKDLNEQIREMLPTNPQSKKNYEEKIKKLENKKKELSDKIKAPLKENQKNVQMPAADSNYGVYRRVHYDKDSGLEKESEAYKILYHNTYRELQDDKRAIQNELIPEIDHLKKTELTGFDFTFASLRQQNKLIKKQIDTNVESYSTDNRKVFYQNEKITSLKYLNTFLFIIFYLVLIVVLVYWFALNRTSMNIYLKLFIAIHLVFYPWLMDWTVQYIIFSWNYLLAYLNGNPFTYDNYYLYYKNTYVNR